MLAKAGIAVVLDIHGERLAKSSPKITPGAALPGAQTPNQMFIGQCAAKAEFASCPPLPNPIR
jgi:hypothetical protein